MIAWLVPLTVACLALIGLGFWFQSRHSARRLSREVEQQLVSHLSSLGIRAQVQKRQGRVIRSREKDCQVTLRQLAHLRVWLRGIGSIEVWRERRKGKEEFSTEDEMTFVVALEPGLTLMRIPILTNLVPSKTPGDTAFEWRGFRWGRLPLLESRLKADETLNRRLQRQLNRGLPGDLRVRALGSDRVGITTGYDPQWLASPEFIACVEDIAAHVRDYVTERNIELAEEAPPQPLRRIVQGKHQPGRNENGLSPAG